MTAGAPTIGGLKRLSLYMAGQLASNVAITGGTINGTSVGATTRSTGYFTRLADNVETGTTTTNLLNYGTSIFGSTAATTFTLDAPTVAGSYKYLHCSNATTAANVTLNAAIQVGDNSTTTKIVFSGKAGLTLKADSTSAWYIYGGYQSSLATLSS